MYEATLHFLCLNDSNVVCSISKEVPTPYSNCTVNSGLASYKIPSRSLLTMSAPSLTTLLAAQRLRWNTFGFVFWWLIVRSDLWTTLIRLANSTVGWRRSTWDSYVGESKLATICEMRNWTDDAYLPLS